jgi:hypothetical protein
MAVQKHSPGCNCCGGDTATIPGCNCTGTPTTLYMRPQTANPPSYQDATFVWGPTPSGYAALALGTNSYLSSASYTDSIGESFRYFLGCSGNVWTFRQVYLTSIFGSPHQGSVLFTWNTTTTGNTCSPLLLRSGQISAGGPFTNIKVSTDSGAYS